VNTAASARSDKSRDDEKEKDSIYGKSRGGTTGIIGDEVLSPIQIAALKGDAKLVRELSAPHLKVDVNFANPESGLTALHIAAIEFQMECIAALKEAFPQLDLQPRDKRWDTPLHWAARKGYEDVVTMLCDIGCSTAIRNKKGQCACVRTMRGA
jgi:ankyrin repeat protein